MKMGIEIMPMTKTTIIRINLLITENSFSLTSSLFCEFSMIKSIRLVRQFVFNNAVNKRTEYSKKENNNHSKKSFTNNN
jgi:hypothetical protein